MKCAGVVWIWWWLTVTQIKHRTATLQPSSVTWASEICSFMKYEGGRENKWRFGVCQSCWDGRETQIKSLRISFPSSICVNTRVCERLWTRWNPETRGSVCSGSHTAARSPPRVQTNEVYIQDPVFVLTVWDLLGFHKQFIKEIFFLLRITWATVKSKFKQVSRTRFRLGREHVVWD